MAPKQVMRGVLWAGLGGWTGSAISLAAFVVTARILGPEPYGIIAFALVFVAIPQLLVGKAAVETLVQRDGLTDDQTTSAL
ncbi:MAG: oligosaccharide flippase family protein [Caulobacterales bacterium]|nr:oligosaccharide flippase family protein [Caulobacterales bacterium]